MSVTRRDCFKLTAGAALTLGFLPWPLRAMAAQQMTLREAAAKAGIFYGANSDDHFSTLPPEYCQLFVSQCALFAPTIWAPSISVEQSRFDFNQPKEGIDFATSHGLKLTGAHLFWYYHMPNWYEQQIKTTAAAEKALIDYVHAVAKQYSGLAYSWNAVNEAINPKDGHPLGLRSCWAMDKMGADYVNIAFRAARISDPKALLVINDAEMELDTPEQEARRNSMLAVVDSLLVSKTPIDGVGLQSHLELQKFSSFNEKKYRKFLQDIAARGLKILITELDVQDNGAPSDIAKRDEAVADVYKRFLNTALDEKAVSAVVTWGLSDRYTWLTPKFAPQFARPDGLPMRPLPFDADFKPTPAFDAMVNAFKNAPVRG